MSATCNGSEKTKAAPDQGKAAFETTKTCTSNHIRTLAEEIRTIGLALHSTKTDTQLETLPKVLDYLGPRGLSTYEGVGLGYLRVATRVKELKETWEIHTLRENVIGPDGMFHKGVGRYVLVGKRRDLAAQGALDLGRHV